MSKAMIPTQQKLAEKLTILNDRGNGLLIRMYNIKKMLGNSESKPQFLSEKSLESALKSIVRKFPNMTKETTTINSMKTEIVKALSLYYETFVDILTFKDNVNTLLTTFDACQVHLDITLNIDLTKGYLDLIVTYLSIMLLLFQVDDRKAVIGLFNTAHELLHAKSAENYPRLGQMILDYDPPLKKLVEEFNPHSKLVSMAMISLNEIYPKRNINADIMRKQQLLSLLSEPNKIMTYIDTNPCEYLSQEAMDKWIIFCLLLCHPQMQQHPVLNDLWKLCLSSSYMLPLCRDEVIHTHEFIIKFFEGQKGFSARVKEIRELQETAMKTGPQLHKDRRKFLRSALKELALVFTDQPGLLGPKSLYVFMALSMARDEIHWLLRHFPTTIKKKDMKEMKISIEDFIDRQLPELLFHMEELRALVRKYNQVFQRYYVQMMSGFDAPMLDEIIQSLSACPEDESIILSSFCNSMQALNVKQVEENDMFNFMGLRLDWYRLQAYTSVNRAAFNLRDYRNLANHMNQCAYHTMMVDSLDQMLLETSDLSIFCFYTAILENQFKNCIEYPAQQRYSIVFPMICSHLMNATHPLCPEERHNIGQTAINYAHFFIREMAEEAKQVIVSICEEQTQMSDKLLPKHCAAHIANVEQRKKNKDKRRPLPEPDKPGSESHRKYREDFRKIDKLNMALTELCFALNYCSVITVWEHGFVPREFFVQYLEVRLNKTLVGMLMHNPQTQEIAKPSELLNSVQSIMSVLQSLENYIHIDITRVFNNILPQQTQPKDSISGESTITSIYTGWYLDVLLRQVSNGHIVYSPAQKAFVSLQSEASLPFNAQEYADITELKALAELIGPYGMKHLNERLMLTAASQVRELKELVILNKNILASMRSSYDKPDQMRTLYAKLQNVDDVLKRMTIIGVLLCFRDLAQEALNDVLENRIPFLMSAIKDFRQHVPAGQDSMIVNEMASAAGLPCNVDAVLCAALRSQKQATEINEEEIPCLMMVFVAVSLPRLASYPASEYKPHLEGHANNSHCLAKAVNALAAAMFTIYGHGDVEERLKEFLALASSSLLRLGQETEKEAIRNRESVYLLLDQIVQESPYLTQDLLESCFPYALLRNSYHAVFRRSEYQ